MIKTTPCPQPFSASVITKINNVQSTRGKLFKKHALYNIKVKAQHNDRTVDCLLESYLSPEDFQFLKMSRTPVSAQSYLPLGRHEIKVSHLVSILLMGLTGKRTSSPTCPPPEERGPFTYWMGYFNGSEQCYFAQVDIMSRFLLWDGEKLAKPAWMRSREHSGKFIRWFRRASPQVDGFGVALGIFLITLTSLMGSYIRKTMNRALIHPIIQTELPHLSRNKNCVCA
ncbi:unnamed protein product [Trichobilharzia regenti]|nr:unnamed protein product [Trichobilharzia regenti]